MASEDQPIASQPPPEIPVSSMRTELEKQRQTSRRLLNDLGSAIYKSASHVRNRAGGAMASAARRTGNAAHYVQEQYLREMVTGLGRFIRRNPAPSLAAVLIAGFLVGRALRNR
jgi:ElaB/YqjD/DUF883 family membrane-anchored ribosome-binding protein